MRKKYRKHTIPNPSKNQKGKYIPWESWQVWWKWRQKVMELHWHIYGRRTNNGFKPGRKL